ncbi:MAG: sugar transferase, partial [Eubacteriales bacterium]
MYRGFFKRFFDIILSFLAIVLLSWLFFIISLAIVVDDPGPVFFKQKRVGKNKKLFMMLK